MLNQLKFAAIDIGSNAVRLLLAGVFENSGRPTFKKMSLTRMPIRLGADTFSLKRISKERTAELVKAMVGFRHLIDAYQPIAFRACATSAMREAENRVQVCKRIRKVSGIEVEIIDGAREAQLILENQSADQYLGYTA
jgi:exopolyphosphatase/guanosine-5'-triphosphate,3'-diphosphate pyrophosphatase